MFKSRIVNLYWMTTVFESGLDGFKSTRTIVFLVALKYLGDDMREHDPLIYNQACFNSEMFFS